MRHLPSQQMGCCCCQACRTLDSTTRLMILSSVRSTELPSNHFCQPTRLCCSPCVFCFQLSPFADSSPKTWLTHFPFSVLPTVSAEILFTSLTCGTCLLSHESDQGARMMKLAVFRSWCSLAQSSPQDLKVVDDITMPSPGQPSGGSCSNVPCFVSESRVMCWLLATPSHDVKQSFLLS